MLGRDVGALAPSSTKLICLLRLFAFLPPNIMLPRFEKEIWVGEVKSSKLPVGMTMSMPWKGDSPAPLESSEWLRDPTTCSSWTTIAGRLGVRRRLVGDEGSLLFAVQFDDVRAESLRSSSSACICVRRRADALGPGLVRGRRTLLSHPRVAGPFNEGVAAFEGASAEGKRCALGSEVVAVRALPEGSVAPAAASSLIATRGAASSHEVVLGDDGGPREMKGRGEGGI